MYQVNKMAVHLWLAFTIASLIYAFYIVYKEGWQVGAPNFFIPAIAFFWWLFRRGMMKRLTRQMEEKKKQQNNR